MDSGQQPARVYRPWFLRKFLAELRLSDVNIVGMAVTGIRQISDSLARCPVAIYRFDPLVGKCTSLRMQRAEIGAKFAIFGTSTSSETTM